MMIISKISVTNVVYLIILLTLTFKFYLYALNHVVGISDAVIHANKHRGNLTKTKYGLFWVRYKNPLPMIKQFKTANCIVSDCVFTDLKSYFYDYSDFDAIIFDDICVFNKTRRPKNRKSHQLYIFSSQEAPNTIPACEVFNDGFYNWSFTYRLDSDVHWSYFIVRNATRHVVAPSTSVQWPVIHSDPKEIPSHVLDLINGRTRAAAWLVSHCGASSQRDIYLTSLREHLASYSLELDVYGNCSGIPCDDNQCNTMLKKKYFFYMSFENSFSPDYVTEKVMHGYKNYVVPIVYGGANYSRFLPPNTYIDARLHHPYNLAKIMHDSINDRAKYLKYFSWINHYTFEQEPEYNPLCEMCEALHSERAKSAPVMKKFRLWWNQGSAWKWCLPEEFWKDSLKAALDPTHLFHYTNY